MKVVVLYSALPLLLLFLCCEGCLEEEREALLEIKASINTPGGSAFSSWYGKDCCEWEGVECDASHVVKMFFQYRRSSDRSKIWYPDATMFAQFKEIQEINLQGNNIGGFKSPKALQLLKHLQKLDLRDNAMANSSDLCWGSIPSLYHLDLSKNQLAEFPKCLCQGLGLKILLLSENKMRGNIHKCLANLTSLQHLHLSSNFLTGKFPSVLFHNLTAIQSLSISHNQFKDVIALSMFSNLSLLSYLDLSLNDLEVETEFPSWSPSFSLTELHLRGCDLNKRSGRKIPSFLSTQHRLQSLDLSYNSLVGSVPSWLFYNVSTHLWLRGNRFSGLFPTTHSNMSSKLLLLDISDNFIHGPIPEHMYQVFPEIGQLNLSWNSFNGILQQSVGEMKQLQLLDLSSNKFHGEISLSNMSSLEYLILSDNHFREVELPRNGTLPKLKELYLDENDLSGPFPDNLTSCPSLRILTIHNNNLSGELSRILPVLPQLRIFVLRANRLKGQIPLRICQMQHLHVVDLSQNYFSGNIPTCIDNISTFTDATYNFELYHTYGGYSFNWLSVLDISSNKLTGRIPPLSRSKRIKVLNLSNNLLTGQIPASLGNLEDLEGLDLSHNNLFGQIPGSLIQLHSLSYFSVSFNNLSGSTPDIVGQFATFEKTSYEGNPHLCNRPLSRLCSEQSTAGKAKEKRRNLAVRNSTLKTTSVLILILHIILDICIF